jgi:hypothetical protein
MDRARICSGSAWVQDARLRNGGWSKTRVPSTQVAPTLEIIRALMLVTRRRPDIATTLTREGNKSAATVGRVTTAPIAVP